MGNQVVMLLVRSPAKCLIALEKMTMAGSVAIERKSTLYCIKLWCS